eukprot:CAMPEP_0204457308 /NCGR_PEP_ID=MMETSP0471-20130131/2732_1 /ASSEMBLY_ACC=CAM_ASM_000602 /TAXON_ID=2969 /ORGANISM="Oxyrrhis marina" /LENGTH=46 /DNA_ID= /DNA_START= /DNA_END= /DNA_ORIENTATION=
MTGLPRAVVNNSKLTYRLSPRPQLLPHVESSPVRQDIQVASATGTM